MKLSALFARFLYEHKVLKLPGIGIFTLDPAIPVPESTDKNFHEFTQHIRFNQQAVSQPDEAFIDFIRTQTGKIKPLAESDLDSFLSDGKILLNIGKPFHIEGIGSLMKTREGKYEFTPGEAVAQKPAPSARESSDEAKKSVFSDEIPEQTNTRKILIALAAIAGIILVIWLGYSLYNRNTTKTAGTQPGSVTVAPSDTSNANVLLDSVQRKIDSVRNSLSNASTSAPGTYKFIIERTSNKARAYRRYNQIKETLTDVRLESKDSAIFTLYFILPAQPSDTARIKDSLRIWYGRKRVWIE